MRPEAFFLPRGDGQRFSLFHAAATTDILGSVVYAHPFGEELNKSRRMAALQARALAERGLQVLQPDLLGCGDSSGDFSDARWESWVEDLVHACSWVRQRSAAPLWLWGLRAGCLLATEVARRLEQPPQLLLWAPVTAGRPVVQQFLRLAAAADLASGNAKATLDALRQQLARGETVEIAGYRTAAPLLQSLEHAVLQPPAVAGSVLWFDLTTQADASLSPVAAKTVQTWGDAGHAVDARLVHGPAFWQTAEIEEAQELIETTTEAVLGATANAASSRP